MNLVNRVVETHMARLGSTVIVSDELNAADKFLEENPDQVLVSQRRKIDALKEPGSARVASLVPSAFVEYTFKHRLSLDKGISPDNLKEYSKKYAKEEIEREVRIELNSLPHEVQAEGSPPTRIQQNILEKFPGGYVRVRKETPGVCTFTRKDFETHVEDNIEISEEMFNKLFPLGTSKQDKVRYQWNGWDIDLLEDGKILAEYEMKDGQDRVGVPEIFDVKKVGSHTVSVGSDLIKR